MTTQVTRTQQQQRGSESEEQEAPADLRNPELDESTECCLADIDELLAETGSVLSDEDLDKAYAENEYHDLSRARYVTETIGRDEYDHQVRIWTAMHGHLFEWCCGQPRFDR